MVNETRPIANPIPKISAYIRHKSESYVSRYRRTDDDRQQQQLTTRIRSADKGHSNPAIPADVEQKVDSDPANVRQEDSSPKADEIL